MATMCYKLINIKTTLFLTKPVTKYQVRVFHVICNEIIMRIFLEIYNHSIRM